MRRKIKRKSMTMSCDYISQNVEYNDEIVNSQSKFRKSQHIRKLNPKYFNSDYVQ